MWWIWRWKICYSACSWRSVWWRTLQRVEERQWTTGLLENGSWAQGRICIQTLQGCKNLNEEVCFNLLILYTLAICRYLMKVLVVWQRNASIEDIWILLGNILGYTNIPLQILTLTNGNKLRLWGLEKARFLKDLNGPRLSCLMSLSLDQTGHSKTKLKFPRTLYQVNMSSHSGGIVRAVHKCGKHAPTSILYDGKCIETERSNITIMDIKIE